MRQSLLTVVLVFFITNFSLSQGYNNRWSIELNPGVSNAVKPYTNGYWSNTIGLYHISAGTRFMFNNKYGLKLDIGFDRIRHDKTSLYNNTGTSLPFTSKYARTSVQFVMDVGRLLQFENFSEKTSLLFHTGGGMSWLWSKVNPETDKMVNFMFGLAPQFKVNERFSITTDVSFVWHIYQQYTWDMYNSVFNRGFDGFYANGTIGLNFYLGKYGSHMDWAFTPCFPDMTYLEDENKNLDSLNKQLQSNLRDDDGDGVANFMDDEKDTPIGNIVNRRGVSLKNIDTDGDGVSDLVDKCIDIPGAFENEGCPQDLLLAIRNNEKDRVITNNSNGNPNNTTGTNSNDSDSLPNKNTLQGTGNGNKNSNELLTNRDGNPNNINGGNPNNINGGNPNNINGGNPNNINGGNPNNINGGNPNNISGGDPKNNNGDPKNNNGNVNNNTSSNPNVVTSREGLTSLVDVHFVLNDASIQPNLYPLLNEIVALLKANPGSSIVLEGHADATGEDEFNQLLSQKRTESLRKYLLNQGIDPDRVQTGSFGESRPKFLNTSPKGRALNRRVEVYFKI
jgi:OOP family OmpA-OmpF porin